MIAPPNRRFANFLIDSALCYFITLGTGYLGNLLYDNYGFEGFAVGKPALDNLKFSLLHTVITTVYYGLFETLTQRSPGKYITGTKVVLRDGTKPGDGAILLRSLCRQIPFEILSFLGRFGIGWHDMFSKTLVVDANRYNHALKMRDFKDIKGTADNDDDALDGATHN